MSYRTPTLAPLDMNENPASAEAYMRHLLANGILAPEFRSSLQREVRSLSQKRRRREKQTASSSSGRGAVKTPKPRAANKTK
jgi:hypothetical protein